MPPPSLFFTLIQIAIGRKAGFDRILTQEEWRLLFTEAQRQAMTGVLFRALERIPAEQRPATALMLRWYVEKERIVRRNVALIRQCMVLVRRLERDGMRPCLLKGPGVAMLYDEPLCRVSGDMDLWLDVPKRKTIDYVRRYCVGVGCVCPHHIGFPVVKGIPVELHFYPAAMMNPWADRALRRFVKEQTGRLFRHRPLLSGCPAIGQNIEENPAAGTGQTNHGFGSAPAAMPGSGKGEGEPLRPTGEATRNEYPVVTPTAAFNAVFLLVHIFKHFTQGGVGMRQVTDYYYLLMRGLTEEETRATVKVLERLHLKKFAGAMMYVLNAVFGMEKEEYIVSENEKEGAFFPAPEVVQVMKQ